MAKTDTLADRLARLERERFDVSYLAHDPRRKERARLEAERKRTEELLARPVRRRKRTSSPMEKLTPQQVYDAGRFSAGARDNAAILAGQAVKDVMKEARTK